MAHLVIIEYSNDALSFVGRSLNPTVLHQLCCEFSIHSGQSLDERHKVVMRNDDSRVALLAPLHTAFVLRS